MLKSYKLILIVCLLRTLCSGQTFFQQFYKTGYHNFYSTNIFPQSDSSHIVFNYIQDSATGRQDLSLFKISKAGSLLINKTFNFFNLDYLAYINGLRQFIPATQSSFFATAVTYTASNATILFAKINKVTLDTIKTSNYYDGIYSYYMNSFIKLHENKYYLIGNKFDSNNQWPCVFHLDSSLNIINTFTINNLDNIVSKTAVLNTSNKKILIGGTKSVSSNQYNVGFIEIDTLGSITNTLTMSFPGVQGLGKVDYSTFDNSYVFNGNLKTSQYGNNSMMRINLTKINASNFTVAWSKTYGSPSVFNALSSLFLNSDGSIVTCGSYSDSTSLPLMNYDTKGVILKTNANGDSLWMRQYNNYVYGSSPTNYQEIFFGVEKTLDGGYILCGNVLNHPQDKAWVVKTDSLGCIYNGCGSVITAGNEEERFNAQHIDIFPNPAADFFYTSSAYEEQKYFIQITDLTGKLLIKRVCASNERISINELSSGIYLVDLYVNDQLISTKKLVVIK